MNAISLDKLRVLLGGRFFEISVALFVFMVVVEALSARRWGRYRTRTFLADLCWYVFYAAGVYAVLLASPLDAWLRGLVGAHVPFLLVDALSGLPMALQVFLYVWLLDGLEYGVHRLFHRYGWLWSFHCLHHSPRTLTPLTKFRVHWMDFTVLSVFKILPLMMLGHVPSLWMPYVPLAVLQVFSHFDLDVHYGPVLGRFLVSPRFHRIHHSADPAQQNTNFGIIFSCWDYLFGTAARDLSRPRAYGLRDLEMPESFLAQLFLPFVLLFRRAPALPQAPGAR